MTTVESTTENVDRIAVYKVSPELYEAMVVLSTAASKDIDPNLAELIKIRASQMNHCAFCLDMHTVDARKQGISEQKLALLPAWEEAGDIFTEQEQAALALTEEMTDLTRRHVSDEVYARGRGVHRAGARSGHRDGTDYQRLEPHRGDNAPAVAAALIRSRSGDPVRCADRRRRRRGLQVAPAGYRPPGADPTTAYRRPFRVTADSPDYRSRAGRHALANAVAKGGNRCPATRMRAMGRGRAIAGTAAS
jgi:AhpD family alkylhydroperoxidase